jgi:epoxyqueuosine reductase
VIDVAARAWLVEQACDCGFDLAGIAAVPEDASAESQRFAEWVEAGRAGEMEWLKRADDSGELVRGDLRRSMPWARSVLVCAVNYNADAPQSVEPAESSRGWIARYAWSGTANEEPRSGADYHDVLLERLRELEARVRARFAEAETRCYVDTGPIVERGYAQRAGIGWIGKNTCVINQQEGSWLLLGVIVTSLPLAAEASIATAADRCGTCTRCIDACPTDALIAPRVMDASRCISYLTIEKKGSIDESLRPQIGRQVFGCDICQDVCPWNRKAPIRSGWNIRQQLVNPELQWLASMDGPTFNRWFRGSPLERTRRKRVLRNVAIAMGNSGDTNFLPRLEAWSIGDDEVLAEAAQWALRELHRS